MIGRKRSPEAEFIFEMLKTTFDHGNKEISMRSFAKCNPKKLDSWVSRHGMAAYFHNYIMENRDQIDIPNEMLDTWKRYSAQIALQNTLIQNESTQVFDFLNQNNISYLMLKGFAYTKELYGSNWTRPISDLDILIKKDDYQKLKDYLLNQGFRCKVESEFKNNADEWIQLQEAIRNEMGFGKKIGVFTFQVDVHWDIANLKEEYSPLNEMFKLNIDDWFEYRTKFNLEGIYVNCLDLNAHFLHMVHHYAYGHQFAGLKWFLDICRFIDTLGKQLDWALIENKISSPGCRRLFRITCQMVSEVLGENHPAVKQWVQLNSKTVSSFDYQYFKSRIFTHRSLSGTYISFIMMPEKLSQKFKILTYVLFNPSVTKRWILTGKKISPIIQPLYILKWTLAEILKKRKKRKSTILP